MRIYACYTPSHIPLLEKHFLPSLEVGGFGGPAQSIIDHRCHPRIDQPEDMWARIRELPQRSSSGAFASDGFQLTCLAKVDYILEALTVETEPFLFSDVDVRFYGPVVDDLTNLLGDADMAFQWDGPSGRECSGLMVLRPSDCMTAFWDNVRGYMSAGKPMMDQDALHAAMDDFKRAKQMALRTVILPERYWTFGRNDKHWTAGMAVNPPADLLLHPANWTVGIENKMALLEVVKAAHGLCQDYFDGAPSAPAQVLREFTYNAMAAAKAPITKNLSEAVRLRQTVKNIDARRPIVAPAAPKPPTKAMDATERTLPFSEVTRMLDQQRARLTGPQHPPLPLALVLQFWKGDKRRAIDLAKLLADIEPARRDDVAFVFARQSNCPVDADIQAAQLYVGKKFPVIDLETEVDESKKYPGVCFDAFANACRKLSDWYHAGVLPYGNAFFFEADGCPIGSDWIDRIKRSHAETLLLGKRVTGPLMRFGGVDSIHQVGGHVNGTMVMHLSCWEDHPSLHRCPPSAAWDVFGGLVLRNEAGPSQIIANHHGGRGLSQEMYWEFGKEHAFVTSIKDGSPQHWCRLGLQLEIERIERCSVLP